VQRSVSRLETKEKPELGPPMTLGKMRELGAHPTELVR
jgi:hypothetical protein